MLKLSEQVRSTHSQDGAIVLDILHGRMFRLNFVGARILEFLKANADPPQIVEEISREFGVTRETADADIHEFIDALEKHHLIERWNSSVTP